MKPEIALTLFLTSGACALANEVLWARAFALAFGGTHQAEAIVLAAFFCGLAAGAAVGARLARAELPADLWRRYGACELVVGLTALGPIYLAPMLATDSGPLMFVACLLAISLPVLAAGATWPLMVAVVRARGGAVGRLYAVTTAGAVIGSVGAPFVLVELLGTTGGLVLSACGSLAIGVAALVIGSRVADAAVESNEAPAPQVGSARRYWMAGAASGFLILAFEAAGARLLALRFSHTVYAFGTVLAVQLMGMTAGGLLTRRLAKDFAGGARALVPLLLAGGLAAALAPSLAGAWSFSPAGSWSGELTVTALDAVLLLGPAALLLGAVFPLASAQLSRITSDPAPALGRLACLNALGGVAGALTAHFVLVPWLGLGATFCAIAVGAGVVAFVTREEAGKLELALGVSLVAAGLGALGFSPATPLDDERVLIVREGPAASVAVLERKDGSRRLVANDRYTLGDSTSHVLARRLGILPAILRPSPERTLVVGLATGITAGGAADAAATHGGRVEVAELLPEVVQLAEHFQQWRGDASPTIHTADGRRLIARDEAGFDLVVFDLFLPWRPGTATLYTQETFHLVRERLRDSGACGLWLPLFQLAPDGLMLVLETFSEAFPNARLYAGHFDAERPVLLLMSRVSEAGETEAARRRLVAGGVLGQDPILSLPRADLALDLGPLRTVIPPLAKALGARTGRVQFDGRPLLEFEGPRARARGELLNADGFRRLVAACDAARSSPLDPQSALARAAWSPPTRALPYLREAAMIPATHPLAVAIARRAAARASAAGERRAAGELLALAARLAPAQHRPTIAREAVRALRAAGETKQAEALLRAVLGDGRGDSPLFLDAAQLALANNDPDGALTWLARLTKQNLPAQVVAARAHEAKGDLSRARAIISALIADDPAAAERELRRLGAWTWAQRLTQD